MINIKEIISKTERAKLIAREQPTWMDPMLATLSHDEFSDEKWIYERKFDGERCVIYKNGDDLRLMSRNKKKLNFRYPEIVKALSDQDSDRFILDGEIVAFEGDITSFSKLQDRMHVSSEQEAKSSDVEVYYYAFDLLYAGNYDLTKVPLRERKKILKKLLEFKDPIRYTTHRKEDGLEYLKEACRKNWEGLIAKKADGEYVHSRSKKWLKFKCSNRQEFIIIGYTEPEGERIGFGALLIGYYEKDQLKYAGRVGTGYSDDFLEKMSEKLKDIEIDHSPLDDEEISDKDIHWVKPKFVGEVSFTEWTGDGKLRHPSFKGLREDKDPEDVVNENVRAKGMNEDEN